MVARAQGMDLSTWLAIVWSTEPSTSLSSPDDVGEVAALLFDLHQHQQQGQHLGYEVVVGAPLTSEWVMVSVRDADTGAFVVGAPFRIDLLQVG